MIRVHSPTFKSRSARNLVKCKSVIHIFVQGRLCEPGMQWLELKFLMRILSEKRKNIKPSIVSLWNISGVPALSGLVLCYNINSDTSKKRAKIEFLSSFIAINDSAKYTYNKAKSCKIRASYMYKVVYNAMGLVVPVVVRWLQSKQQSSCQQ